METITIVDPSLCTDNVGDEFIMDAVDAVVWELFPRAYIQRVPSHEALSDRTRRFIRRSDFCFIGGTNLLTSRFSSDGLWRLDAAAAALFGSTHTVCLGTGWTDYMPPPAGKARALLRATLSKSFIHSTRDTYSRDHLERVGRRAVSTACPTMWSLTPGHCQAIPRGRSTSVVFTLTAWRRDVAADKAFIETLRRFYGKLYFFAQMREDHHYLRAFGYEDIVMIRPTAAGFTEFLRNEDVDVVGTRLHGGIRALQYGRRTLILTIDNRAAEIARDTGLPVIPRSDLAALEAWIVGEPEMTLAMPWDMIDAWKAQFRPAALASVPPVSALARARPLAHDALPRAMRWTRTRLRRLNWPDRS